MTQNQSMSKRPSLGFIIPFAPKKRKKNWSNACLHLKQTIQSIRNSTNLNFSVVVVSHDDPCFDFGSDERISLLKVDYPLPEHKNSSTAPKLDKLHKIHAGWNYLKSHNHPRYVMKLDADDFISCKLVDWVDRFATDPGYLIRHGWIWKSGEKHFIQKTESLDRICGSCLIIRNDIADIEGPFLTEVEGHVLDDESSKFADDNHYSIVPGSGIASLILNDSHQRYEAQFKYLGYHLETLPFHAVVYRDANPDSMGLGNRHKESIRMKLGKIRRTRMLTNKIKKEYNIVVSSNGN